MRLRHLLRERDVRGRTAEQVLSIYRDLGVVPKAGRSDNFNKTPEDLSSYKLVIPGDVVVNKMKAWQGSIAVSSHQGIVSGDYLVCEVGQPVEQRYLHHLLRSRPMIAEYLVRSKGIRPSQWRLYWDDLADIEVRLPSPSRQRAIADYLDTETARIDALIAKKRALLDLVDERWRSDLVHASAGTAGRRVALRRVASLIDCKHRTPEYVNGGYPVVSPGDVTAGTLDLSRCHRFVARDDWADLAGGERRPRVGDIVYSRNASVGLAALVTDDAPFCMGQDVCLVRTRRSDGDGRFLAYVLNTSGLDQIREMQVGSTFFRINVAQIADLLIPDLSEADQDDLVARWDALTGHCDRVRTRLAAQIDLLIEHRRALITATVTGEVEVPVVAA